MFAAVSPAVLVIGLAFLVIGIWAIYDSVTRPDWAWQASGQNKTLWIILNVVGLFVCGFIPLGYILAIRPKVAAAQKGGNPGGYAG